MKPQTEVIPAEQISNTMELLHAVACIIDEKAFELPEDAIEGAQWELRRQWAAAKAHEILSLISAHLGKVPAP